MSLPLRAAVLGTLFVILAAPLAQARSLGAKSEPALLLRAEKCPALFGTSQAHAANAEARRRSVYWIHEELEGITVAHSKDSWRDPDEVSLKGLQLVGVRGIGSEQVALVRPASALAAALGCAAGDYAVRTDDDLGRGLRVVVVVRAGVLLEKAGRLAYLRRSGVRPARWFLAWSAPGQVRVPEGHAHDITIHTRMHHADE